MSIENGNATAQDLAGVAPAGRAGGPERSALMGVIRGSAGAAGGVWGALRFVRFRPFDTSTEQGRSAERYRRIVLTAAASMAARGVGVLTTLISVPLVVSYLGTERYGVWMTISSVVMMLAFADLGIGNGLLTALSRANGTGDRAAARRDVSSAFFMLAAVAAVLCVAFAAAYPFVPWPRVFNVRSPLSAAECGPTMAVLFGCFIASIPLGVVQRVQAGYQEGFAAAVWQGAGNVFALGALLAAVYLKLGLPWLVLAVAGAPVAVSLAMAFYEFYVRRPWIRPAWGEFRFDSASALLKTGLLFFVLQLAVTVGYQSDGIVIAQTLGADRVTDYAVPSRLFTLAPVVLSMFLMPLWPAYGEALARGDVGWAKRTLKRSIGLGLAVNGPATAVLVALGPWVFRLWVGDAVRPGYDLLVAFGLWALLNSLGGPLAMFLNAANVVAFQGWCASLMAVANIVLSIVLARRLGVCGVVYGTVISQLLFIFIPSSLYVPRLLASMRAAPVGAVRAKGSVEAVLPLPPAPATRP